MQTIRNLFSYLKYYFKSKTKYQIHSPFVFEIVTKVIKQKTFIEDIRKICYNQSKFNKYERLVFRLYHFLNVKTVRSIGKPSKLTKSLQNLYLKKDLNQKRLKEKATIDMIIINPISINNNPKFELEIFLKKCHNNSVIIIENKQLEKPTFKLWQHLKNHPRTSVSIDIFKIGLIFIRKEQAKEHFMIRF